MSPVPITRITAYIPSRGQLLVSSVYRLLLFNVEYLASGHRVRSTENDSVELVFRGERCWFFNALTSLH